MTDIVYSIGMVMDWLIRVVTYWGIMYAFGVTTVSVIAKPIRKKQAELTALHRVREKQFRSCI